jgi:hypothetical protein
LGQIICQGNRRCFAIAAGWPNGLPSDGSPPQKRTTSEDYGPRCHNPPGMRVNVEAGGVRVCTGRKWHDAFDHGLAEVEVGQCFEVFFHDLGIEPFVALGPQRLYGGAFAFVEQTHLNKCTVSDAADDPTKGVYFAHQMSFGWTTNRGVTRQVPDFVEVNRKQNRMAAHAGSGGSGFATGVASADYCDVIYRGV